MLFGNQLDPPQNPEGQKLKSKDDTAVVLHINELHQTLCDQNVFQRMTNLIKNKIKDDEEAESVDQALTNGCLAAENKCSQQRNDDWTAQVQETILQLSVLCQIKHKLKKQHSIEHLTEQARIAGSSQTQGSPSL